MKIYLTPYAHIKAPILVLDMQGGLHKAGRGNTMWRQAGRRSPRPRRINGGRFSMGTITEQDATYRGFRTMGRCHVERDGVPLDMRLDLWNHSPTGYEWGYLGSGPAQTALAILADALGNDRLASRLHQSFKVKFVASLSRDLGESWQLDASVVRIWAKMKCKELRHRGYY